MGANKTIMVTGANGFIGSCLVAYFISKGIRDLVVVDHFDRRRMKHDYLNNYNHVHRIDVDELFSNGTPWEKEVQFVVHLGAISSTLEKNVESLRRYNLEFSKKIWEFCTNSHIPLVYASSAATYGTNIQYFSDEHADIDGLIPVNGYAKSKHEFDRWALSQNETPPQWIGFKFFNVYGPNEYHKGSGASMVFHAYNQIMAGDEVKLFKSYRREYDHGNQKRDFIYVMDIVDIIFGLVRNGIENNGLFNLGTGKSRSFNEMVRILAGLLERDIKITYIDIPHVLERQYQYFTEADMTKFHGFVDKNRTFTSLEIGISHYIQHLKSNTVSGIF